MTSPGSTPALAAAPPGDTVDTIAPVADFRPKSANPSRGAADLALAELRQQLPHSVAGHGEADADVPFVLGVGDDRGVHADDLAPHVQQRSAGVARVDRGVGLQHLVRAAVSHAQPALGGADDANSD